ncbi:MAG: phosphoadenylyl-sulfate reductase [Phycisphaerae bacterium]|nr:phosphoadenylyl-sulfate reductase [Phycisphaerae bacterium]
MSGDSRDRSHEFDRLNAEFERLDAADIVRWAVSAFDPDVAVSSSFGADSAVMLHLCTQVKPDILVVAVDTGFLFPETIAFRAELTRRLGLNLRVYRPTIEREAFLEEYGKLWRSNPDACCAMNKREPFERAKRELQLRCWMTGIRREQSFTRREAKIVLRDYDGLVKVCPIATWRARDVHEYMKKHDLPYHPLRDSGFLSIGCQPEEGYCTTRVKPGEDPRSGRWAGFDKTECGLHKFESGGGI